MFNTLDIVIKLMVTVADEGAFIHIFSELINITQYIYEYIFNHL